MRRLRVLLALVTSVSLYQPLAGAELIWGEITSLNDNGQTMVIQSYDSLSGEIRNVTVTAPPAETREDRISLDALEVGDEVIVDAKPEEGSDKWQAYFMNLPDPLNKGNAVNRN